RSVYVYKLLNRQRSTVMSCSWKWRKAIWVISSRKVVLNHGVDAVAATTDKALIRRHVVARGRSNLKVRRWVRSIKSNRAVENRSVRGTCISNCRQTDVTA